MGRFGGAKKIGERKSAAGESLNRLHKNLAERKGCPGQRHENPYSAHVTLPRAPSRCNFSANGPRTGAATVAGNSGRSSTHYDSENSVRSRNRAMSRSFQGVSTFVPYLPVLPETRGFTEYIRDLQERICARAGRRCDGPPSFRPEQATT
jgi:hypothetical protein